MGYGRPQGSGLELCLWESAGVGAADAWRLRGWGFKGTECRGRKAEYQLILAGARVCHVLFKVFCRGYLVLQRTSRRRYLHSLFHRWRNKAQRAVTGCHHPDSESWWQAQPCTNTPHTSAASGAGRSWASETAREESFREIRERCCYYQRGKVTKGMRWEPDSASWGSIPIHPACHGVPAPACRLEFTIPVIPQGESKDLLL